MICKNELPHFPKSLIMAHTLPYSNHIAQMYTYCETLLYIYSVYTCLALLLLCCFLKYGS